MGDEKIAKKRFRIQRLWTRRFRKTKWLRNFLYLDGRLATVIGVAVLALVVIGGKTVYTDVMATYFNHPNYTPLLNAIAEGESRGNYNAYFGNTTNATTRFTDMSVADVLKWQQDYVHKGSPSSAVGKYQIIRPTLAGLVQKLKIDPKAKFDEELQDRMAVALLEKRGVKDYMQNKLTRDQFAANLAQEWAALPKATGPNPGQSYYAGDGINKSRVSIDEIYGALASMKQANNTPQPGIGSL